MEEELGLEGMRPKPKRAPIQRRERSTDEHERLARVDAGASASVDGRAFPTSRFPPVPLVRPLELFGASFAVEVSSHLCLGPDTVLRAAIGKSVQTLLRDEGLLGPFRQMRYALLGKHKLTETTRATVLRTLSPISSSLAPMLDGARESDDLQSKSDWQCVATAWGVLSEDNLLDVIVSSFVKLDELGDAAAVLKAADRHEDADALVAGRFSQTLPAWREICPQLSLEGCIRIETSLLVLTEVEAMCAQQQARHAKGDSVVESFLDPKAKPIGHWCRQLLRDTKCNDLQVLSDLLERKQVRHQSQRSITHDTLKGWSAMRPGMLMSLKGCQSILEVVADKKARDQLVARFALARFLAFLCDFLRSSVRSDPPTWKHGQRMLLTRYLQMSKPGTDGSPRGQ
ncbi:hypothetical protein [Paucibacter soli]|uniref:hypothetical protein n=1 Tax=Paucibacter soli TaxID=3133433 RepID=UPI00309AEFC5